MATKLAEARATGGHAAIGVKVLRAAMNDVLAVVEKRNTIPVLSGVLITVGPSTMTLTASDMDLQLVRQLDLEGAGTGRAMSIVIDADTLSKICRKLPADAVVSLDLDAGKGKMIVTCGRTRYELHTLPADDFPVMPVGETSVQFEMPKATLQQLVEAVAFAQSTEETRYYLNGIFLHADAGGEGDGALLLAAATDGHRLAVMSVDAPEGADGLNGLGKSNGRGGVIVGRKAVRVLSGLIDSTEGPLVELAFSSGKIVAEIGTVTMTAKLIDGEFPDYRRVIPSTHERSLWIDSAALAAAVGRVVTVSTEKTRAVALDLGKGLVKARVSSPEHGTAEEEIEAQVEGDELTIGFNAAYLGEVLKHLTASPALMRMTDGAGPTLIMDSEDARRRFVVMPMRV